jgi:gluconokinase
MIMNEHDVCRVPRIFVVMGVSGCGKSTVGQLLAQRLGWPFVDADKLHSAANIAKMAQGMPLTDDDRWPWLTAVAVAADDAAPCVVACSALRQVYRDFIVGRAQGVCFIWLDGDKDVLYGRLCGRQGHFAGAALLESQLQTLEPPLTAWRYDISQSAAEIVAAIFHRLST